MIKSVDNAFKWVYCKDRKVMRMLVIMTLNPSLDYYMTLDEIQIGMTNHSKQESVQIGGKGINVALMLHNLEVPSCLLGFAGGFTGKYLVDSLDKFSTISSDFIETKAITRINVKVAGDVETEINGTGSDVSEEEIKALMAKIEDLSTDDVVMISGRLASGMDSNFYLDVAKSLHERGIDYTLDITGPEVLAMCKYQPLVLKPNLSELEAMFDVTLESDDDIIKYGLKLIEMGAKHCIVSLGSRGSLFFNGKEVYQASIPDGDVMNTVGAGDSMLAGFVMKYLESSDPVKSYLQAVACGSATAYSKGIGSKEMIDSLLSQINIQKKGD